MKYKLQNAQEKAWNNMLHNKYYKKLVYDTNSKPITYKKAI